MNGITNTAENNTVIENEGAGNFGETAKTTPSGLVENAMNNNGSPNRIIEAAKQFESIKNSEKPFLQGGNGGVVEKPEIKEEDINGADSGEVADAVNNPSDSKITDPRFAAFWIKARKEGL